MQVPRIVVQRWGVQPGQRAVHYVGHSFSIGSSGASRAPDERTLVADLGNEPSIPQLMLFMDGRGVPMAPGKQLPEKQGAMKALHLTPFIAAVQRGPEILQALSDEPANSPSRFKHGEPACFLTHLIIPAAAEIWIGDRAAQPGTPEKPAPVPPGTPVFIRIGDAVIAVKFLLATDTSGKAARVEYVRDEAGSPAMRLTVTHSATKPDGRGTTVVWLRAAEGLAEAAKFDTFRKVFTEAKGIARIEGSTLTAEVAGEQLRCASRPT